MNHFVKIISIVCICCLSGCAIDAPIDGNICEQLTYDVQQNPCSITNYSDATIQYLAPCFNPNNSNEFVFLEVNNDSGYCHLCVFNRATGEKQILSNEASDMAQPKWYYDNRILFDNYSGLCLINSDGTNMQQLTYAGLDLWPEWIDADNICSTDNANWNGIHLNLLSGVLDTLTTFPMILTSVSSDKMLATLNGYRDAPDIIISHADSIAWDTLILNANNSASDRIEGIDWHPNNQDLYFAKYMGGIYKVNILAKQVEAVADGCFAGWYSFFDISPEGDKIIAEKITSHYKDCIFYLNYSIISLNIDGSNEFVILGTDQ